MQIRPIFITATGTNVGKTYTTLKLVEAFAKIGINPVVFKPIETGVIDTPLDSFSLLQKAKSVNSLLSNLTIKETTSFTLSLPAAPYVADTQNSIHLEKILADFNNLKKYGDILLIEGAGGLLTPISKNVKMVDLIKLFDAHALLVTSSKLGSINDTLLSIEALQSRQIKYDWCVNIFEDKNSFEKITKPYYDAEFPAWWSVQDQVDSFVKKYSTI